jgi:DNA-binding MarR family transcriptional regulator
MKPKAEIRVSEWRSLMEEYAQPKIPEGFQSLKTIAGELGLRPPTARRRLEKLEAEGRVEVLAAAYPNARKYYRIKPQGRPAKAAKK